MGRYRYQLLLPRRAPELLGPEYLRGIMDSSLPHMSRFYRVSSVNDPSAFARIATLEYLFETLGVSV